MFFILSKALYFLIQPINWLLGSILFALLAKNPKRKKSALILAVFIGFFFTNHFLYNQFIHGWEMETITADQIDEPYDIGILLGGYSASLLMPDHDRHNFSSRGNRFFNAYELYKTGKVRKLLLTGGTGDLFQSRKPEAPRVQDLLIRLGVPASDIIVEDRSRNTYENALYSKEIIDREYPQASLLLITSAFHMRRSDAVFRKVGLECTPFSVDFLTERHHWDPGFMILPDRNGFYLWEILIKEWVGYVAYML